MERAKRSGRMREAASAGGAPGMAARLASERVRVSQRPTD